ncbi:hypothetical protein SuUB81_20490 [Streptococcus uberis]|uniref:hypothetical protein n=1 Tax=Streptococcus uberis TaxID=1349 RepID=UPI0033655A5F
MNQKQFLAQARALLRQGIAQRDHLALEARHGNPNAPRHSVRTDGRKSAQGLRARGQVPIMGKPPGKYRLPGSTITLKHARQ